MPPTSLRPPRNEPERSFPLWKRRGVACLASESVPCGTHHCGSLRDTARVVSSLGYHPANSKRAQRAICNEKTSRVNSDAILRISRGSHGKYAKMAL